MTETESIDIFRAEMAALKQEVAVAGAFWQARCAGLYRAAQHDDVKRFLQWPVMQPMVADEVLYIQQELNHLLWSQDWATRWAPALEESDVGSSPRMRGYPKTSPTLVHHAHHMQQFEESTGERISDCDTIVEFGGGYGGFCRLVYALGFRGTYIIYDLPELGALQRHFLRSIGFDMSRVKTVSAVEDLPEVSGRVGFVAAWSLNESPIEVREAFIPLCRRADRFLVAHDAVFEGIDNAQYFQQWRQRLGPGISWLDVEIPYKGTSFYLFGVRNQRSSVA